MPHGYTAAGWQSLVEDEVTRLAWAMNLETATAMHASTRPGRRYQFGVQSRQIGGTAILAFD